MTFYELKQLLGYIASNNKAMISKDQIRIVEVCPAIELDSLLITSVTFKFNRDQQEIVRADDKKMLYVKCLEYAASVHSFE